MSSKNKGASICDRVFWGMSLPLLSLWCRSCNTALLKRLEKLDALLFMVDLLISEPPGDASKERSYRQPFVVVEMMTGPNEALTEALSASTEALERFWSFLEAKDDNPVL
eukprot:5191353-Amphidinium_carterae.1